MNTKVLKISTFAIIAILAFSCKSYEPIQMNFEPLDESKITHSIDSLIKEFGSLKGDMFPVRTNSGDKGLFSVDTIPSVATYGSEIIIAGRVISDDSQGSFYKTLVIQDIKKPMYALKISVVASAIGGWYPLGSVVSIRCNGLALGKYADMFQLGISYFNPNNPGYEPGRMPLPMFQVRAKVHSLPEFDKIVIDTVTIAELNTIKNDLVQNDTTRAYHSRIVLIRDVYFTGQGWERVQGVAKPVDLSEANKIFAPTTNGIGYPQSRVISDGTDVAVIATSEYARFCNVKLPPPSYKGNIIAIIAYYNDRYGNTPEGQNPVQLTLRSLEDLDLYNNGQKWEP